MTDLDTAKKVVKAWKILNLHPSFDQNPEVNFRGLKFLIDPTIENGNGVIDDDKSKNIHLRYWYEILVPVKHDGNVIYVHDWDLDGSSDTYEQCILDIYDKIIAKYGEWYDRLSSVIEEMDIEEF